MSIELDSVKTKKLRPLCVHLAEAEAAKGAATNTFIARLDATAKNFPADAREQLTALVNAWSAKVDALVKVHEAPLEKTHRASGSKQFKDTIRRLQKLCNDVIDENNAFRLQLATFASRCPPAIETQIVDLMNKWTAFLGDVDAASDVEVASITGQARPPAPTKQ